MDNLNLKTETFSTFQYNEVTDSNCKEVHQHFLFSKKYVTFVEFRYTLVTKLLNFNYTELDSAVHCKM